MQRKTILCGVMWLWLFLGLSPVWAKLPLESDYAVLAGAITTDPALTTAVAERNWPFIASYYNTAATPDFWILRESVSLREVYERPNPDGALWDWTVFFSLPSSNLEQWRELWVVTGTIDPRQPNVVPAILTIMPGAPYVTLRTFLLSIRRRLATRGEALFLTGTGTGTTANPSITRLTMPITENDVCFALGLCPLL